VERVRITSRERCTPRKLFWDRLDNKQENNDNRTTTGNQRRTDAGAALPTPVHRRSQNVTTQ